MKFTAHINNEDIIKMRDLLDLKIKAIKQIQGVY